MKENERETRTHIPDPHTKPVQENGTADKNTRPTMPPAEACNR